MKALLFLALGYGSLVALMYGAQASLIFPGTRLPSRPLDHPFSPERLTIAREDGVTLAGMLFAPRGDLPSDGLVIGFGGNAQDAEVLGQDLAAAFAGLHVAVFHYRGYGESGGSPGEAELLGDAEAIHDRLVQALAPQAVYALGISLGSGIASYLSKQRPLDGVLLITPYDSIEAVAKAAYPWLPVGLLLKHRFPSVDFMVANPTPAAIIAAENDRVIKPERTAALRQALPNLVFDRRIDGAGHGDIHAMPAYQDALGDALEALKAAGSTMAAGPRRS
ncbi:MAG: alpha/beta fold hydrolase [Alphaproteobacteria bacterium]